MATGTRPALVTGGAGFIGSHVVDALLADGREVVALDDLSTGKRERVNPAARFEQVDITDAGEVDRVVKALEPTAIYHLAAQSSVTVSVKDPERDAQVNVIGTLHLLEAAGRHGAPLIFTSTGGALYGNRAPLPTPETWIPEPEAPYGASKWAGEAYIRTWALKSGIPHAICRLGNVYGPRQSPHGEAGVVSIFSRKLMDGEQAVMFGFGEPTRDYIHVSDIVSGMKAAEGTMGVFNLGTGIETPVSRILELVQQAAGTDIEPIMQPLREGELQRSCLDSSKARELGWAPTVDLTEGIRETFDALCAEWGGR